MRLTAIPRRLLDVASVVASRAMLELPPLRRRGPVAIRDVLMLADQFPPTVSGGVYRPLSFAAAADAHGWRMSVVTHEASGSGGEVGEALARAIPADARVRRIQPVEGTLPEALGWDVDGGLENALQMARETVGFARGRAPAVVLATGPHFHTFVAGYFLKRQLGSKLVLDYRDEWSECPFHFVRKGPADVRWERRCLAAADLVVFTTPSMREHALRTFDELDPGRAVVVENGVVEEELAPPVDGEDVPGWEADGKVTIGFMGNLSRHTDPGNFLNTLAQVVERRPELADRLRLLWVGTVRPRQRELIQELDTAGLSRIAPQVSRGEAQRLMKRCTLLLLIVNPEMDRYRPGKLYSYLASGRPVVVYGSEGESGDLVRSLGAGSVVAAGDVDRLEAVLTETCSGAADGEVGVGVREWIVSMDRSRLAGKLYSMIEGAAGG